MTPASDAREEEGKSERGESTTQQVSCPTPSPAPALPLPLYPQAWTRLPGEPSRYE
ncbi:hypothetical protein K523DRAFT_422418 [Schizophyllum commune Tattone D]|nr:hypothetical protein K523DRAFT_422418 [Schizophyllum commune Tattone D]